MTSASTSLIRVLQVLAVPDSLVFFRDLPTLLRGHGIDVAFACAGGRAAQEFSRRECAKVYELPIVRQMSPRADARAVWNLRTLLHEVRPDIVHAHTPKGGLIGMLAAAAVRTPRRIYTMHGAPLETKHGLMREVLRNAERTSCALATEVHCVSPSLRRLSIRERLGNPNKMRVLGSGTFAGIDIERFSKKTLEQHRSAERRRLGFTDDHFVFGFVGRLTRDKGVRELMCAWSNIAVSYPNARMLVVGDSDQREPLDDKTQRELSQLEGVVRQPHTPAIELIYATIDVLVLPSYREGFPTVPLEAAAMGIPSVVSRATGCVDAVIDGVTGYICDIRSVSALEARLRDCLDNKAATQKMGQAAYARVGNDFASTIVRERLVECYLR